jgi:hypothetical protein
LANNKNFEVKNGLVVGAGFIELDSAGTAPSSTTNKLYNVNGVLYYGSSTMASGQSVNVTDSVTFAGLTVSGDFIVNGTTTTLNTKSTTISDPLLHLADSNIADISDIGFVGHYVDDSANQRHTGLVRDASNGEYYLFTHLEQSNLDSTNVVEVGGSGWSPASLTTGPLTSGPITATTGTFSGLINGRNVATDGAKLDTIETSAAADQTGAEIKIAYEGEANAFTDTQFTKLATIEDSASADQTGAEIKAAYEAEPNAFTDAQFTKLGTIDDSASADQTGAEIKAAYEVEVNAFTDTQFTKLGTIEDSASADQTGAEIKIAYEGEANAFTDTQFAKLATIEDSATADQTGAQIKAAYEGEANAFTDTQFTKLATIEDSATADQTAAQIKAAYEGEANAFTDTQFTKLSNIETSATADQTGSEIKAAYEGETNAFTDTQFTKLSNIETSATADQTGSEIKIAYEGEANAFTDTQFTKLSGIETSASADQSDAEIETAYNNQVAEMSQGEAEGGSDVGFKRVSSLRLAQAIAAQVNNQQQHNFVATTDPTTSDDTGAGYAVGSKWINITGDESFTCVDATSAAAVWQKTTLTSDELATVAITGSSDDLTEGTTKKLMTTSERSKLSAIEASADVTDDVNVGTSIHGASAKTTPVDADTLPLIDSAASNVLKKVSWTNIKATIKAYFDTLYPLLTILTTKGDVIVRTSSGWDRLAIGTTDYVLTADSAEASGMKWAESAGGDDQNIDGGNATSVYTVTQTIDGGPA